MCPQALSKKIYFFFTYKMNDEVVRDIVDTTFEFFLGKV
jgi:hypothetical protein